MVHYDVAPVKINNDSYGNKFLRTESWGVFGPEENIFWKMFGSCCKFPA